MDMQAPYTAPCVQLWLTCSQKVIKAENEPYLYVYHLSSVPVQQLQWLSGNFYIAIVL